MICVAYSYRKMVENELYVKENIKNIIQSQVRQIEINERSN